MLSSRVTEFFGEASWIYPVILVGAAALESCAGADADDAAVEAAVLGALASVVAAQ